MNRRRLAITVVGLLFLFSSSPIHNDTSQYSSSAAIMGVWALPDLAKTRNVPSSLSSSSSSTRRMRNKKALRRDRTDSRRYRISIDRDDRNTDTTELDVSVHSFLLPRRLPLRSTLHVLGFVAIAWWLRQCLATSGVPFATSVWTILNQVNANVNANAHHQVSGSQQALVPPPDFWPTIADIQLATLLAPFSKGNEMLPPTGLPSARSIAGLLVSGMAYLCMAVLLPRWSIRFRVWLDYTQRSTLDLTDASIWKRFSDGSSHSQSPHRGIHVLTQPQPSSLAGRGTAEKTERVFPLQEVISQSETSLSMYNNCSSFVHPEQFFFEFNQCRIYCDPETRRCVYGAPTLHKGSLYAIQHLVKHPLCHDKEREEIVHDRYQPYNCFDLATPTLKEAVLARLLSPMVVIQLIGMLMSSLEAGMQALTDFALALAGHYWNARQAIMSGKQIANDVKTNLQDTSKCKVWKLQKGDCWEITHASKIVPGDIFRLSAEEGSIAIPVDALILKGQCLTNEAILTGESVPQVKQAMDFDERATEDDLDQCLDMEGHHRSSILFAGTDLVWTNEANLDTNDSQSNESVGGVLCLALRTGVYSSKGQLLDALKSSTRVGAIFNAQADKDAIRLTGVLSICGLVSCLMIFVRRGSTISKVSSFRRVVQCTRIMMAAIPSGLSSALSSVARSCSRKLRVDSDVSCSEPGSLLTAAYVDIVIFDKTGTLTADTQSVAKLVPVPRAGFSVTESFQKALLAGCHSLVHFKEPGSTNKTASVIGDPLDVAALQYSGWTYNRTSSSYFLASQQNGSEPSCLYKIRDFPFDPNRRVSSSIVLVETNDKTLHLWRYTKGAPETVRDLCTKDNGNFGVEFNNQTEELEMQGYRTIALAAEDISKSPISRELFPNGLSATSEAMSYARLHGNIMHRSDFESAPPTAPTDSGLALCGFCCFDAALRPSSRRVISELSSCGIECMMVTGDSMNAAISISKKAGLIQKKNLAVLDFKSTPGNKKDQLVWKLFRTGFAKDGSFQILLEHRQELDFTKNSLQKFLKLHKKGKCALASNGPALEWVLNQKDAKRSHMLLGRNLASISVVARATPDLKRRVVKSLQSLGGRRVMMCGDGVNDVAAIESADVAAALLTGFGDESDQSSVDLDDIRRMKKLNATNIGSNRATTREISMSRKQRISRKIELAQERIDKNARRGEARGGGVASPDYSLQDTKDMLSAIIQAYNDERQRKKILRSGGGKAAQILHKERSQLFSNGRFGEETELPQQNAIKPGEVSLVASFSCLHPSIDGVEALLRQGIATAAAALATQQSIVLHSLMACFHLATLYRDGFRYGKFMWPVESAFNSAIEMARYKASCTPRPRLPTSVSWRPSESLFNPATLFLTVSQALIHIIFMAVGVSYAKRLEGASSTGEPLKLHQHLPVMSNHSGKLGAVLNAISSSMILQSANDEDNGTAGMMSLFFRRPPFRPNFVTNVVFLLSVLQSAISSVVDHRGKPFHQTLTESRETCRSLGLTIFFYVVCISGSIPSLTKQLEVKPFPTRNSKLVIIGIGILNGLACFVARWIADGIYLKSLGLKVPLPKKSANSSLFCAADHEERLLEEEAISNTAGMKHFLVLIFIILLNLGNNT